MSFCPCPFVLVLGVARGRMVTGQIEPCIYTRMTPTFQANCAVVGHLALFGAETEPKNKVANNTSEKY